MSEQSTQYEKIRSSYPDITLPIANAKTTGLMSKEDKIKLDALVPSGTIIPEFPVNIDAKNIIEDEEHKFVKQVDIDKWNNADVITEAEKTKLDGIAENANNYTHPNDVNTRHVSDIQIKEWSEKASKSLATVSTDGLMSKEDKTKLDGIAAGANNYVHPASHPATIVTEDDTHMFVTKEEKELLIKLKTSGLLDK